MTWHFSLILVNTDGEVALLKQTDHNIYNCTHCSAIAHQHIVM